MKPQSGKHTHTHTCVLYCSAGVSECDAETHPGINPTTFTASLAPPSGRDGDGSQLFARRRRPPVNISDVSINNGPCRQHALRTVRLSGEDHTESAMMSSLSSHGVPLSQKGRVQMMSPGPRVHAVGKEGGDTVSGLFPCNLPSNHEQLSVVTNEAPPPSTAPTSRLYSCSVWFQTRELAASLRL